MDRFQVDLRGIVDLLSRHLYSSPRVYARELLQNSVDAITARRSIDPSAPGEVDFRVDADGLTVTDSGVGLTAEQMQRFLATIGQSSKRDDFDFARGEFLGQFGIGLLSCFMVSDRIVVRSRSAAEPGATTVQWSANADGTYEITPAQHPLDQPGTEVVLTPARNSERWLDAAVVRDLVTSYGSQLPARITVNGDEVTGAPAPWRMSTPQAAQWCERDFGFTPFAVVPLEVAVAGVHGVAFVLPEPANPAERAANRVYLKGMLLSESVQSLLPDWAFFVRCVVDATALRPTAAREDLFQDALLDDTRTELGNQLRDWLIRLSVINPSKMTRFLDVHHMGVKAVALHDDDMLDLVRDHLRFETTAGVLTMAEYTRTRDEIRYTRTVDEFRALSAVASGQGYDLVNAGYAYDEAILARLTAGRDVVPARPVDLHELADRLQPVATQDELSAASFLGVAAEALAERDCTPLLRRYDPVSLPAFYLPEPDADAASVARAGLADADEAWTALLSAVGVTPAASSAPSAQLVLNHQHPLVRRMLTCRDDALIATVVAGLYGQALLQGRHPMRPGDTALLNAAMLALAERSLTA